VVAAGPLIASALVVSLIGKLSALGHWLSGNLRNSGPLYHINYKLSIAHFSKVNVG